MTLRIRLLGTARLSHDDQPLLMRGHKPLALLAYLLITGKAQSRQHLVDLLFDGPSDPKASLRWTLSELRKGIGADYIVADRQQIGFDFESDYWLDVTDFEAGQLDLYRGDFLEDLHIRDAFSFEDWVLFERERLRGRYQTALEQQLAEADSRGDDPAIIEIAHQLLRLDNLREDWYRLLMRAYAQQGKREAALAGLAVLYARQDQHERALELAMRILQNPASSQEAKDRAKNLRTELEAQLTSQQIEAVQVQAQAQSFEAIVKEILNTVATP